PTAAGSAKRRSPRKRHSAHGSRTRPATPRPPSPRSPRTAFWAHLLLQQLGRPPVHGKLRLQLPNPSPRNPQLLAPLRTQPRQLAEVDQLLPPPRVDRLVADLQQLRHLGDRLPRSDQIERPPTELRRIPPPSHTTSSRGRPSL